MICRQCEVQAQCLQYALDNFEHQGIWGGMGPNERQAYRQRLQRRVS